MIRKFARRALWALLLSCALGAAWLVLAPPELIRVGAGYTAKIVCSSVFISGRDPDAVLRLDVQASGHPLLRLMRVSVDREARVVRAGLFGLAGNGLAVARDGTGCATVPDGDLARAAAHRAPVAPRDLARAGAWPEGDAPGAPQPAVAALLADPALAGPGMRALLVLHRGRIVAERYGEGFTPDTPLLGWSMTKTVTAALIGTLVRDGRIDTARTALFPAWGGDARRQIAMTQLLSMSDGLSFNEDYGAVTDITRMLYLEPDMAAFAAGRPGAHAPGAHFNYSSGSSVLLARLWQDAAPGAVAGLAAPGAVRSARHGQRGDGGRCARHIRRLVVPVRHGTRLGALRTAVAAGRPMERLDAAAARLGGGHAQAVAGRAAGLHAGPDVAARTARQHAAGAEPGRGFRVAGRHRVDEWP